MKTLRFVLGWCVLSVAYGFLALAAVATLFGREGTANHLIGLAAAFVLWLAASVLAVWRRLPPAT